MGHVEHTVEVGVDHLVPLFRRHLVEHGVARDAGIVDQDLDRAEFGLDLGDPLGAGLVVGDVPLEGVDARLRLEGLGLLVIAGIVRRHPIAGGLERDRNRRPDTPGSPRHQCNSAHVLISPQFTVQRPPTLLSDGAVVRTGL
ncbi:hypothetical protein D3C72_1904070 [compost metagenome]